MKYSVVIIGVVLLFASCGKKTGASDEAMSVVNERFSQCHLKDSLGDSNMTYLWSEYDSEHNSVLCFRYGSCAIEYYFHTYEGYRRDTFLVKTGQPIIDELREFYKKMTDKEYLSKQLTSSQYKLMEGTGFTDYFEKSFPTEEDYIDYFINGLASNDF